MSNEDDTKPMIPRVTIKANELDVRKVVAQKATANQQDDAIAENTLEEIEVSEEEKEEDENENSETSQDESTPNS